MTDLQEGSGAVEHTEDCPADRDDCTCGGYVPLSVAENLATALASVGRVRQGLAADPEAKMAYDEFRAAYPREETT